jgi:UDP-N-acetylmuramyl tripeptide synthase
VLLAGKGHETYQLIDGKKIPFSEREILLEAAKEASLIQKSNIG